MNRWPVVLTLVCICSGVALAQELIQERESIATVLVEGSEFTMGTDAYRTSNEGPAHSVTVSPFRIGESEVPYALFEEFVDSSGYLTSCERDGGGSFVFDNGHLFRRRKGFSWRNTAFAQHPDSPVISVSWIDAVHFANWLSLKDGFQPAYTTTDDQVSWDRGANGWRLPTEAEWEFAARGGIKSSNALYGGSNTLSDGAWYDENSKFTTHRVKQRSPNELGLYDIIGNAYEWCWDRYGAYGTEPQIDPQGPESGLFRVYRGGSWYSGPYVNEELRNTTRSFGQPELAYNYNGMRLVRNGR